MKKILGTVKSNFYNLRRQLLDPLAWYLSKRELDALMDTDDIVDAVEATGQYTGRGYYVSLKAFQVKSEIMRLAEIVQQKAPKTIVEIGTNRGGTLFIWCRTNPTTQLFVSIDLPGGRYGGGYHPKRKRLYQEFISARDGTEMALIRGDSHELTTLNELRNITGVNPIDFLFIDGDHTYEGVKKDFTIYSPFVKSGIIALHDIATKDAGCGVHQYWDECKEKYDHLEIIAPGSKKGIGVIFF